MNNKLRNFLERNNLFFKSNNITIDEFKNEELDFVDKAEQADLFSESEFARITIFESGRIYIQILNMQTEETVFFFDDLLDSKVSLEEFLLQNIKKMIH